MHRASQEAVEGPRAKNPHQQLEETSIRNILTSEEVKTRLVIEAQLIY